MDALARDLTPTERPACEVCLHARAQCGRRPILRPRGRVTLSVRVGARSAFVEAWRYDACGRHAHFFEPKAAALTGRIGTDPAGREIPAAAPCCAVLPESISFPDRRQ